ncbi:hypothetical protein GWI33_009111 [Rhynchophorus ferrugineus]|uniref:Uncharacterized protein n=1 Tax=Rhynchophorus ferrugineus TaxID=354439 RepID=A0A834IPV4_RHYFE|nr:hypothetical protein GWI33_009111 [Rhynchophorus ferrugineus]
MVVSAHSTTLRLYSKVSVPGYTSEWTTATEDQLEQKTAQLELTGVGGSWGALRIRCEANLFRLYRANSVVVEVKPDTPQPASVLLMGPSSKGTSFKGNISYNHGMQVMFVLMTYMTMVT